jgi:hypothetical protein
VGQQIVERDGAGSGHGVVERSIDRAEHAGVLELRRPCCDRVVEREAPLLEQLQRCRARDRLAQRRDAEDRVALERQPRFEIAPADGAAVSDAAVAPDQGGRPSQAAFVHRGTDGGLDRLAATFCPGHR